MKDEGQGETLQSSCRLTIRSSFFVCSLVPGMLATCSVDKTVTLWDTHYSASENVTSGPPRIKMNKDMKVGKLYTLNFYPSSPWLLACAGGAKELALWDMTRDDLVQKCFGGRSNELTANEYQKEVATNGLDDASKREAFDAMMSSAVAPSDKREESPTKEVASKKKKDKGKKKKKVHRAGR
jgi:WD40 repeat protein